MGNCHAFLLSLELLVFFFFKLLSESIQYLSHRICLSHLIIFFSPINFKNGYMIVLKTSQGLKYFLWFFTLISHSNLRACSFPIKFSKGSTTTTDAACDAHLYQLSLSNRVLIFLCLYPFVLCTSSVLHYFAEFSSFTCIAFCTFFWSFHEE